MPKKDINQTAFAVMQVATGEVVPKIKRAASVKGGLRGGKSRMDMLSDEERKALAKKAADARWRLTAPVVDTGAGTTKLVK
jgi:hypothetical protein